MCGIAGKVYLDGGEVKQRDLKTMAEKIAHRGPDDEGIFISSDRKVGLANRRLAIVDLTARGISRCFTKTAMLLLITEKFIISKKKEKGLKKKGIYSNQIQILK